MANKKLKDILNVSKEVATTSFLSSETFTDIIQSTGEYLVSEGTASLISDVAGCLVPGVNSIVLAYKQKKFQNRVNNVLEIICERIEVLERNFSSLSSNKQEAFRTTYLEWLMENLYNEKQDEKTSCYISGYVNLMSESANDNLMLMFFNTINELTTLDIEVLRMYSYDSADNIYALCDRQNLKPDQVMVIKEKLARLGLLQSKNDEYRDENLDYIVSHLEEVAKENKKKNPKTISISRTKIKKINKSDSFHITRLGIDFLKVISI
ncbi:MAG: hypothetical protein E7394_07060 [Ruminococcaceae bacterium]|nr:hypothetical protein [Oscillospiraceae bacterium]